MSKRGSKNAKNYAGKLWDVVRNILPEEKANDIRSRKKKLIVRRNKLIKKQFDLICKSFNINKSFNLNELEELYKYFDEHYTKNKRSSAVDNVKYYKLYCEIKNKEFSIQEYLTKHLYDVDIINRLED